MALTGMRWIGSKNSGAGNTTGTGEWIMSLLPSVEPHQTYIEPFAGMLGILLARPKAHCEIVNDLDGRVVNWWRAVRDEPEELARLVALTPYSRDEFNAAWNRLKDCPDATGVRAALDFTIAVSQNVTSSPARGQWVARHSKDVNFYTLRSRISALGERVSEVQLENRPAEKVLARSAREQKAVIYCDPPYRNAADPSDTYKEFEYDRTAITDALLAQRGSVAISGYGDEWDHLGWRRHEWPVKTSSVGGDGSNVPRTEVLWTNYEPPQRLL